MFTPEGKLYSAPDWSGNLHPTAEKIIIPEGYSLPLTTILSVTIPCDEPPVADEGRYIFAVGLTDQGTTYFRSTAHISVEIED